MIALLLTGTARADSLRAPYSYERRSANGQLVFVMLAEDDDAGLRQRYRESGLYPAGSTTPLWTVDWYSYGVEVADDGVHLVRTGHWMSGLDGEALAFFARDRLLRACSLRDLLGDAPPRPHTASYATLRRQGSLDGAAMTYTQPTSAGDGYVFDLRTGELIRRTTSAGEPPGAAAAPRRDLAFEAEGHVRVVEARGVSAQLAPDGRGGWTCRCQVGERLLEGPAHPDAAQVLARVIDLVRLTLAWEGDPAFAIREVALHDDRGKLVGGTLHGEPEGRRAHVLLRPSTLVDATALRVVVACGLASPPQPAVLEGALPISRAIDSHGVPLEASARWEVAPTGDVQLVVEVVAPEAQAGTVAVRGPADLTALAHDVVHHTPGKRLVRARFGRGWLTPQLPVELELALPLQAPVTAHVHGGEVEVRGVRVVGQSLGVELVARRFSGPDDLEVQARDCERGGTSSAGRDGALVQTVFLRPRAPGRDRLVLLLQRRSYEPPRERAGQRVEVLHEPTRLYRLEARLPER